MRDDDTQVLDLRLFELTLLWFEVELVLTQAFQHNLRDTPMFFERLGEDQDVVDVHADDTFHDEVLEYLVHHRLERRRAIGKAKEHHQRFEQPTVGSKSCLPLITLLHPHIVVPPSHIELHEVLCATQL